MNFAHYSNIANDSQTSNRNHSSYNHHVQHQNFKYNNSRKQNRNMNKNELTRDDSHWCETCDRGFRTFDLLEQHQSEHQVCGIDGCKFIAHPNVVTKHIQMQHSTGLYNKIRNLNTPEDISKWIAERKKNFPSRKNVEKQKAELTERLERGEKLQEKKSRFNNKPDRGNNSRGRNKKRFQDRKNNFNKQSSNGNCKKSNAKINASQIKSEKPPVLNDNEEIYCGLHAFKGISEIIRSDFIDNNEQPNSSDEIDIQDEEWQEANPDLPVKNKMICKALSFLMDAYNSSSEDETNESINKTNNSNINNKIAPLSNIESANSICLINESQNTNTLCKPTNNSDDSGPEVESVQRTDVISQMISSNVNNESENTNDKKPNRKRNRKRKISSSEMKSDSNQDKNDNSNNASLKKNKLNNHPRSTFDSQLQYYKERPSTLLEKILEKEIKHERNVILQCLNYIVKNDFFQSK